MSGSDPKTHGLTNEPPASGGIGIRMRAARV